MTTRRYFIVLGLFATPWIELAACSSSPTTDGGADTGTDHTTADVGSDVGNDVASDVGHDVGSDVSSVDASDASDAAADVVVEDASDATADATDATDAGDAGDAAEAGSSWKTPTCDGVISPGEYGSTSNQTVSGGQTWYMTWDATNLYVAVTNANLGEANIVYVGFSGTGIQTAQVYDGTGGTLPFLADGVVYAKNGYQETRIANGDAGMWGTNATNTVTYCDNTGSDASVTVREEAIPWTALGASAIPSGFRFLAYLTSSGGSVYGQLPTTNAGGTIGTSYAFPHDFHVLSTANGTGSFPFDNVE